MPKTVTLGLIQTKVSEDVAANIAKTEKFIRQAARKGAQIICLQELYNAIYFPQQRKHDVSKFLETIPGPSTRAFSALAKELGVVLIVPIFEQGKNGKNYNSAVVIDESGRLMPTYRKLHIPHDPGFYEQDYFEEGDLGYRIYKTKFATFAVFICFDQWFPEAARIAKLKGAEIIFYPTAIGDIMGHVPEEGDWHEAWETIQRSHAIANSVVVAAVNRVGPENKANKTSVEGKTRFWGQSFISDPFGKVIKRGSKTKEEVVVGTVDLGMNEFVSEGWGFLRNRRPDTYGPICGIGYRMPAEWEHHDAIWLAWPYDDTTFPGRVPAVEQKFVEIIKAIHTGERVELLVLDEAMKVKVRTMLQAAGVDLDRINFHVVPFQDVWTRDYGPLFVVNREKKALGWVKFKYNAYGKSDDPYFAPLLKDNDLFNQIKLPGKKFETDMVLEGGSIEVNGQGMLITTEQCLLNPNRNPHLSKEQIEQNLKDYLGVSKIIWLKRGLVNDHTDGHIDDIAKFVAPNKIICAYEDDPSDENYGILKENFETLKDATDCDNQPFEVIKMPMPHMKYDDGTKAPVSYINCYIGNTVLLAETFNDSNDAKALEIWQSLFPDRKVVPIDCREIIYGGGALHCMSQQQPSV